MDPDFTIPEGKAERDAFIKPFRSAVFSSKADKKKLEDYKRFVYETKFTKQIYREALLATRDAHLYTTATIRNTLLEEVRSVIRAISTK